MLSNKIVLITGANRGIGRATALRFAEEGATLYLNARKEGSLDTLCEELKLREGAALYPLYFDVADPAQVKEAFQFIFKTSKQLDVLVNNAGILEDALIGMVSQTQITHTFATNTFSVLTTCQYASRMMMRKNFGSIINVSSIVGCNGNAGQAVYAGSKAAILGITKSLAKELAPHQIRVNAIAPGLIETDMAHAIPADKFAERVASIKMGRIGTATDAANAILFLASDLSTYITGQIIGVDGGMMI